MTFVHSRNTNNNIQHFPQQQHAVPPGVNHQWQNGQNGQNGSSSHPQAAGVPPHMPPSMRPAFPQHHFQQFGGPVTAIHQNDPAVFLRDASLDCFKTKLATNKTPDGAEEIHVDNDKIGAIIGRGGSRIAEIRRYSTQDIKIHEKDEASSTRRITVNGQQDQIDRAIFLLHVCLNVYTKPKEKVGQWTLLQAVHYARGSDNTKVQSMPPANAPVSYPDQNGLIPYPNYMDFSAQFLPQPRFQPPRVNYPPSMSTKKRNLPEPAMEITTHDEEIPTNAKREKFRTY